MCLKYTESLQMSETLYCLIQNWNVVELNMEWKVLGSHSNLDLTNSADPPRWLWIIGQMKPVKGDQHYLPACHMISNGQSDFVILCVV